MAKTVEIKIPDDIEFRVIGNLIGVMISSAGLLGGEMLRQHSFDYWLEDIVPLILLVWMCYRMFRNFISTMNAYQDVLPRDMQQAQSAVKLNGEQVAVAQLPARPSISAEKVVEEVAKRIEANKKKNG